MSRYIDLDKLLEKWNNMSVRGRTEFDQEIMVAPTIEVSEDCISREWVRKNMLKYGFLAPDMTVTEFVADAPSVVPTTENEIKLCRNCDNAYIYQDCLYCDEIEEETEIEPDDACSLWKLRVSLE